jgi:HlyD family secretion protein
MQKNLRAPVVALRVMVAMAAAAGCSTRAEAPEAFQGVVELDEVTLGFDVGGRVERVDVAEGQVVEERAPLASLDASIVSIAGDARRSEVAAAEAQLALLLAGSRPEEVRATSAELEAVRTQEELAQKTLDRQRALVASGAVGAASLEPIEAQIAALAGQRRALGERLRAQRGGARAQEIAAAEARVRAARAALAGEEERLARASLKAPRAGTVLDVHVDPGEVVGAGTPVVTMADARRPYVDVFVPEGRIGELAEGDAVAVRVDAVPGAFAGKVEHLARRTEFTPRFLFSERERPNLVLRVRVRVDEPSGRLPAGVPAFVTKGSP